VKIDSGTVLQSCNWAGSAAESFLDEDIDAGLHELMPPGELRLTRNEYMVYPPKVFSKRIDQTLQTRKFHAYREFTVLGIQAPQQRKEVIRRQ
jgi:hypothetical protein